MRAAPDTAGILSRPQIMRSGPSLMQNFAEKQVRGAGYDLRAGNHIRDPEGNLVAMSDGDVYALKPGEGMIVVTKEILTLDQHLAANVTLKTGVARTGILLLSGMLVDPRWKKPLHLTILNIGSDDFLIYPGRPIAAVQFVRLAVPDQGDEPTSQMSDGFFDDSAPKRRPVAFLEKVNDLDHGIEVLRRDHDGLKRESDKLGVLASQVIPLAVLLLVATLFGVVIDASLSLLSNRHAVGTLHEVVPHTTSGTVVFSLCLAFGIAVALLVWLVPRRALVSRARYKALSERLDEIEGTPQRFHDAQAELARLQAKLEAATHELEQFRSELRAQANHDRQETGTEAPAAASTSS